MEEVILVDRNDNALGTLEKIDAHRKGLLHRAFSILLFNSKGEMLLQKRAREKYHSAGLWTNACCSHPLPGEKMENALQRKLKQEMGIETALEFSFKFIYKVQLENNLVENELDHVYIGKYDGEPAINASEVEDWKYISMAELKKDIAENPATYTYWFKIILNDPRLKL